MLDKDMIEAIVEGVTQITERLKQIPLAAHADGSKVTFEEVAAITPEYENCFSIIKSYYDTMDEIPLPVLSKYPNLDIFDMITAIELLKRNSVLKEVYSLRNNGTTLPNRWDKTSDVLKEIQREGNEHLKKAELLTFYQKA